MKNSKSNQLMPQSKNLATTSMPQFANPHNFSKTRTQTVTPNMMRSPPTGLNTGSGINKLNVDFAKSKLAEGDVTKQKNLQNMNLGGLSRSSTGSQQKQQKRDFISMQQALGFLNFINANQNEAFRMPIIPLQQIQQHSQNISRQASQQKSRQIQKKSSTQTPLQQQKQSHQQDSQNSANTGKQHDDFDDDESGEGQLTQNKKKLNKNRAIKRIIQTAYQLLQKNYHFTSDQNQLSQQQRSTSTQFNIYLKQYNRIIQQINSKQYQQIQTSNLLYENNEQQLQQVFEYTVMDDFRDRLFAFFTKERLGKDNVDLMIKAFRDVLVTLKLNELKVEYFDSQQPAKIIKMSEIQNVQYYTHPYIFIALTINKDKTKSKQQLYLKFSSQQNQDKWDRALYCCFMSRKMTKKDKLFEIEFPVEDVMKKEKAQYKKEDQVYQVNEDYRVIDRVFRERESGKSPNSISITHTLENNDADMNMLSDRPEYMNLAKNRTEQRMPVENEDVRRINTTATTANKNESPFRNIQMKTNVKNTQSKKDSFDKSAGGIDDEAMTPVKRQQSIFVNDPNQEESNNLSKKSTFNVNNTNPANTNNQIHPRANTLPQGTQSKPPATSNPFMKLLKIAQQEPQKKYPQQKSYHNSQIPLQNEPNKQTQKIRQQQLLQEKLRKLKRIREIQKNNVRGVICQKQKFFINKQKIIFFYDQTMLNSSRKLATTQAVEKQNLQSLKYLTSQQIQASKFIEYWDYDYKKDQKQERKLIPVSCIIDCKIVPSVLGQTTTSLVLGYNFGTSDSKVEKKELAMIFANPISGGFTTGVGSGSNIGKAEEVYEWIRLVKSV